MAETNLILKAKIVETFGTQSDFAESLGLSESYVSNVVRGRKTPDVDEQRIWAHQLGCYRKSIFGE